MLAIILKRGHKKEGQLEKKRRKIIQNIYSFNHGS